MGGVISAPTLIATLEGCKTKTDTDAVFAFSKDYQALVAEIAEVIIPRTDTPGAKDAGVGPFIETMLRDCYSEVQKEHFVKGLDTVEEESKKLGAGFIALKPEQKIEVIKIMQAKAKDESSANDEKAKLKTKEIDTETGLAKEKLVKKEEPEIPVPFFNLAKELTLFGYFTSEPGATKALDFIPIPGRYEGCIPLKPGQKAYAL
jgi:hypothetical protein